jgi:hypothetical protein
MIALAHTEARRHVVPHWSSSWREVFFDDSWPASVCHAEDADFFEQWMDLRAIG